MAGSQTALPLDVPPPAGHRAPAVCHAAQITYRQLDHWTTNRLLSPSVRPAGGSGTQRLYSLHDVIRARIAQRLREAGVTSLPRLRGILDQLPDTLDDGLTLAIDHHGHAHTLGDPHDLLGLLRHGHPLLAITLGPIRAEIAARLAQTPTAIAATQTSKRPTRSPRRPPPPGLWEED